MKVHYSTIAARGKEPEYRIMSLKRLKGLLVKSKHIKLIWEFVSFIWPVCISATLNLMREAERLCCVSWALFANSRTLSHSYIKLKNHFLDVNKCCYSHFTCKKAKRLISKVIFS